MPEKPAEPAEAPAAVFAALRPARLRAVPAVLGGLLALAALLVLGRELIAASVPQHRAALEELIRHETGLEVSFSRLSVHWGWYGPEAVFHEVTLAEPGAATLLRAPQLSVAVDAWRSLRSGHLEAARIRLINPAIDLGSDAVPASAPAAAGAPASAPADARRLLARWRGGLIQIEGGSLRWAGAGAPVTLNLRRAELQRLGEEWSAQVLLLLPDTLGAAAQLGLRLRGDPAAPQDVSGSVSFQGERLAFAGWRTLGAFPALERLLPRAGGGNLAFEVTLSGGTAVRIEGSVHAQALEWEPQGAAPVALLLPKLAANWQLTRVGQGWHLALGALDVGSAAADGSALLDWGAHTARGSLHEVPLPALAAFVHWYAPQLPLEDLALSGAASVLTFDFDARRASGERLQAAAQLRALTLASATKDVQLSGLSAQLSASETSFTAEVHAAAGRLLVTRAQPLTLSGLALSAGLSGELQGSRWHLSSDDLQVAQGDGHLTAQVAWGAEAPQAPRRVDAHVELKDADALALAALLGPDGLAALAPGAARLTQGRISSAEFELHGPAAAQVSFAPGSHGRLELRQAAFAGADGGPAVEDVTARIEWAGPKVRAHLGGARSGDLTLIAGHAEWDAHGAQALRATARLSGGAAQALAWLRAEPQLTAAAPLAADLDLEGDILMDLDLVIPGAAAHQPAARTRVTAALQGVRLRALPGIPALEGLQGTLAFASGHLQRSTLVGRWLGGPVTLGVAEHRDGAAQTLVLSARGLLEVHQALLAAGAAGADAALFGSTEWSAQLTLLPQQPSQPLSWRLRADSGLTGLTSSLPEPLTKNVNTQLPLHLEVQGQEGAAQLRLALADRLSGIAALERSGDQWRLARGALHLGAGTPQLPQAGRLTLDGRVSRFDLPAYVALVRAAGQSPALPPLEAQVNATELIAAARSYHEVALVAHSGAQGGEFSLQSAELAGSLSWPAQVDTAHPARLHLVSFAAADVEGAALGTVLTTLLGPAVELMVDDLSWQGRALGRLSGVFTAEPGGTLGTDLRLDAAQAELRASLQCSAGRSCGGHLSLISTDLEHTLAACGLRPDIGARHAELQADLQWPQGAAAPLASLSGHLHMRLEEGATHAAAAPEAPPFALWLVPALLAGLSSGNAGGTPPQLGFTRLTGDFELHDGSASTANLHLDGDAEILVRGRVGLASRDYDAEAVMLRGEERLPAALRRLGPTPKVAALWLSLRGWFTGTDAADAPAVLRLRGTWNDPIVMPPP